MEIQILYKNGKRERYDGVEKIYNLSTNFPVDYLYIKEFAQTDKDAHYIPFKDILCFNIQDFNSGGRLDLLYDTKK